MNTSKSNQKKYLILATLLSAIIIVSILAIPKAISLKNKLISMGEFNPENLTEYIISINDIDFVSKKISLTEIPYALISIDDDDDLMGFPSTSIWYYKADDIPADQIKVMVDDMGNYNDRAYVLVGSNLQKDLENKHLKGSLYKIKWVDQ